MIRQISPWFREKGRRVIVSLVLATMAWFAVHSARTVNERRRFNIAYTNISKNLTLGKDFTSELQFQLTGPLNRIRSIDVEESLYEIDLSGFRPGRYVMDVDSDNLKLPFEVSASSARPARVEFTIENLVSKDVPVSVQFDGFPPDGYSVAAVRVSPSPVPLQGPESALRDLEEIVIRVPVADRKESFSTTELLPIDLPQVKKPSSVLVEVDIAQKDFRKNLVDIPVVVIGARGATRVEPETANLTLQGSPQVLEKIKGIRVEIPADGLRRGRYRLRGRISSIPGVEVLSMKPESFVVEILN